MFFYSETGATGGLVVYCSCNFFHLILGLIAEFVRRHHYCESVSVLGRFMPIRDSYNNKMAARKLAEKIAVKKAAAEAESLNGAANGHHHDGHEAAGTESVDKDLPDDVFESVSNDVADVELGLDDEEDDENADEEEDISVSLDEVESARRDILDPTKQQKLRKGFRMASICWDD